MKEEILAECREKMNNSIEALKKDFGRIRTGRASTALLDGIKNTPPAAGFDEVLVPGDVEHRTRVQRLTRGIEIPDTITEQLHEWADKLKVSLSDDLVEASDIERYQKVVEPGPPTPGIPLGN